MKAIIAVSSILAVAATLGFVLMTTTPVDAAFKVQRLNDFFLTNQTTGEPMLAVAGQLTNNGTEIEDYVDIALTLFNQNDSIAGVGFLFDDDVKPNDTIPFEFLVNPEQIENGDFNNIKNYTVTAE